MSLPLTRRNTLGCVFVLVCLFAMNQRAKADEFCFAGLGYEVNSGISLFDCMDYSYELASDSGSTGCENQCQDACQSSWTGDLYRSNNCQEESGQWRTGYMECYCYGSR